MPKPASSLLEVPTGHVTCPCCGATLDGSVFLEGPDRFLGTGDSFAVSRCSACGAGVTLPQLGAADLAQFYPDAYGPYVPTRGDLLARISALIQWWQGTLALRGAAVGALRELPPGRAVDVGCGRGDLAAFLTRRGWRMTGVEPSESACMAARVRGVDARAGTLATVRLEQGAYDAAIFRQSLEHVTDPVADLRRVRAALRPGGLVLITVPNFGSWQRRRFGSRWFHLDLPRHRVHFTPYSLDRALDRAGFVVVEAALTTSAVGLPGSVQYAVAGRCLFPTGLSLQIAAGLATLAYPIAALLDRLAGAGDGLSVVAVRRD
jgi:SAM-dependent methyltransferase